MSQHYTPVELARETGRDRQDVIETCTRTGVPIFQGHIDRSLFEAAVRAEASKDAKRA